MSQLDQMVTIQEAAEALGVSTDTVRRRIANGSLPASRVFGRAIRIKVTDLERNIKPIPAATPIHR